MLFASTHSSCSVQCCASHQHMLSITLSHANFTLSHDAVNSQLTSYGHDFNVTCALSHSVSFLFTSEHTHTRVAFSWASQFTTHSLPPTRASLFPTHPCTMSSHKHHHITIPSAHYCAPSNQLCARCVQVTILGQLQDHIKRGTTLEGVLIPSGIRSYSYFTSRNVFPHSWTFSPMSDLSGSLAPGAPLATVYDIEHPPTVDPVQPWTLTANATHLIVATLFSLHEIYASHKCISSCHCARPPEGLTRPFHTLSTHVFPDIYIIIDNPSMRYSCR